MKKIISEHSNILTIISLGISILTTWYIIGWKLSEAERTFLNVFGVVGGIVSMFGLVIALIQIIALQEITEVTQNTINETKSKLILGISISDVAESIKLIAEIESFIGSKKHEIARFKLIDLKDKLIQFKSSPEFLKLISEDQIDQTLIYLNFEISQLYIIVFNDGEMEYDSSNIAVRLQEILTHLTGFKNQIKYQTI